MEAYERHGRALIRRAARVVGNPDDARDLVQALFVEAVGAVDAGDDLAMTERQHSVAQICQLREIAR